MRMLVLILIVMVSACVQGGEAPGHVAEEVSFMVDVFSFEEGEIKSVERIVLSEDEWRERLTADQYRIARENGTERAFTGQYVNNKEYGLYRCVVCGTDLFLSEQKYDSGSGWPSFVEPVNDHNVETTSDSSLGINRVEVRCARCGAHLGHVFPDGPQPTGLRYCVNSASLTFERLK